MDNAALVLRGLGELSEQFSLISGIWHVIFFAALVLLAAGWRPTHRQAGVVLALPAFSVSILSLLTGHYINGLIFAGLFLILMILSSRFKEEQVSTGWNIFSISGALMVLLAWLYTYFFQQGGFLPYLYGSPVGVIPSPTLSIMIGFTLLFNAFKSRVWALVLGLTGLAYGLVNAFWLGISLDYGLMAGSLILILIKVIRQVERE